MTTLQHTAVTWFAVKEGKCDFDFDKIIPYALLPDSIRMYGIERQLTHFERSYGGDDVSHMVYPERIKSLTRESIAADKTTDDYYLSADIKPCCIGEETIIESFDEHNGHLPPLYKAGVRMHLWQDKEYDADVRTRDNISQEEQKQQIAEGTMTEDMPNAYADRFILDGQKLDAKEYRQHVAEQSAFEYYCLACIINDKYPDVFLDQEWMDENLKPALDKGYSEEMSNNTYKYMQIHPQINDWIKGKVLDTDNGKKRFMDKSHVYDVPGAYDRMKTLCDKVLAKYEQDKTIMVPKHIGQDNPVWMMDTEKEAQNEPNF